MDNTLKDLYRELLSTTFPDNRTVLDRITPSDLCVAGHHVGRLYNKGLLIYGQAMNGWQNEDSADIETIIREISDSADRHQELYTMVDCNGWNGLVDGEPASYHYKTSKFWKLNYQVITGMEDTSFNNFYVNQATGEQNKELFDNAWSQTVAWSNLYKISYSKGGNPDDKVIETINKISLKIILKEIELLKPSLVLFNTGENLYSKIIESTNPFKLAKNSVDNNVLYTGIYEYLPNKNCKIVVCRRPDVRSLHYTNTDIVNEASEILTAFKTL